MKPVSLIAAVRDQEATIVPAIRALTALRYPVFEVVVVDDGSADGTFARLRAEFDLVAVPRLLPADVASLAQVSSVHVPRQARIPLVVVRKPASGRPDSLNAAINLARYPLVCVTDPAGALHPDALLAAAQPFSDDPGRVIAVAAATRVTRGPARPSGAGAGPGRLLAAIQAVERLRTWLVWPASWSRAGLLLTIPGRFAMFSREVLVAAGGFDPATAAGDAELAIRLHRQMRDQRRDYRIAFVADPVSWAGAPESLAAVAGQRRRRQRGMTEVLLRYRSLVGNPRYGRLGLVALPATVATELLLPAAELAALAFVAAGLASGVLSWTFAWQFAVVGYGYPLALGAVMLTAERLLSPGPGTGLSPRLLLLAAIAENIGFRQLSAVWRIQGSLAALRRGGPAPAEAAGGAAVAGG